MSGQTRYFRPAPRGVIQRTVSPGGQSRPQIPISHGDLTASLQQMAEFGAFLQEIHKKFLEESAKTNGNLEKIKQGPPGARGVPGMPGQTYTMEHIVQEVMRMVRLPKDGKPADENKIAKRVLGQVQKLMPKFDKEDVLQETLSRIVTGKIIKPEHIDGLLQTLRSHQEQIRSKGAYIHGGGDSVLAGTNVTITKVGSRKVISASSAGITIIAVAGTKDDSNVTFTAASEPKLLNINGAFYQKTGGTYTWSYAAGTITLNIAIGTGGAIFGMT